MNRFQFDGQAFAMMFMAVVCIACTFVAKKWFASDTALAIQTAGWASLFIGALLRHFNGPAAPPVSNGTATIQDQPNKVKEIA